MTESDWLAIELLDTEPTTTAGIVALVRYVAEFEKDGNFWLDEPDTALGRSWPYFLHQSLSESLGNLAA